MTQRPESLFDFVLGEVRRSMPLRLSVGVHVEFSPPEGATTLIVVSVPKDGYRAEINHKGVVATQRGTRRQYRWEDLPGKIEMEMLEPSRAKNESLASVSEFNVCIREPGNAWTSLLAPGRMLFWIWNGNIRYRDAVERKGS